MTPPSRRAFIERTWPWLLTPAALTACRRRSARGGTEEAVEADRAVPARPPLPATEPIVRVRVLRVRDPADVVRIDTPGRWIELSTVQTDAAGMSRTSLLHAPIDVAVGPGGWSIRDDRRFRPSLSGMEVVELRPGRAADDLLVGGLPYPGTLRLDPRTDLGRGRYDVVNHVLVERYLPGVLAGELYPHWQRETYAAQAVAARSFALSEHAYFGSRRHYDVTNTASSQVYGGSRAHALAVEATQTTRGLVLASGGRLVPGYYSSCCGGVAATALDAIGSHPFNEAPPLRGRSGHDVCTEAPLYAWRIERPVSDVTTRMAAYGRSRGDEAIAGLRRLTAIEVASRNDHGRPVTFAVKGTPGVEAELGAETLRRAVDHTPATHEPPEPLLWSSNVAVEVAGDDVRFDGHGHGHGVGLCQYGAEALAQEGETHDAIVRWYYPDVQILPSYG